jgi:hypothetical protein
MDWVYLVQDRDSGELSGRRELSRYNLLKEDYALFNYYSQFALIECIFASVS